MQTQFQYFRPSLHQCLKSKVHSSIYSYAILFELSTVLVYVGSVSATRSSNISGENVFSCMKGKLKEKEIILGSSLQGIKIAILVRECGSYVHYEAETESFQGQYERK